MPTAGTSQLPRQRLRALQDNLRARSALPRDAIRVRNTTRRSQETSATTSCTRRVPKRTRDTVVKERGQATLVRSKVPRRTLDRKILLAHVHRSLRTFTLLRDLDLPRQPSTVEVSASTRKPRRVRTRNQVLRIVDQLNTSRRLLRNNLCEPLLPTRVKAVTRLDLAQDLIVPQLACRVTNENMGLQMKIRRTRTSSRGNVRGREGDER